MPCAHAIEPFPSIPSFEMASFEMASRDRHPATGARGCPVTRCRPLDEAPRSMIPTAGGRFPATLRTSSPPYRTPHQPLTTRPMLRAVLKQDPAVGASDLAITDGGLSPQHAFEVEDVGA